MCGRRLDTRSARDRGFTLVEVLVASSILSAAVLATAGLVTAANRDARQAGALALASLAAEQRLEQLRSLTFGVDAAGAPVTDTSTNLGVDPPSAVGGTGLTPSPAAALDRNTDGYYDVLDAVGRPATVTGPFRPALVRRWAITPIAGAARDALVLQVRVVPWRPDADGRGGWDGRAGRRVPGEARLTMVRRRGGR